MKKDELYAEKANRNRRYQELKRQGKSPRRSSTGPQQIHPMYVEDRKAGLTAEDKGFGNSLYDTSFPNLYKVTWEENWAGDDYAQRREESGFAQ